MTCSVCNHTNESDSGRCARCNSPLPSESELATRVVLRDSEADVATYVAGTERTEPKPASHPAVGLLPSGETPVEQAPGATSNWSKPLPGPVDKNAITPPGR